MIRWVKKDDDSITFGRFPGELELRLICFCCGHFDEKVEMWYRCAVFGYCPGITFSKGFKEQLRACYDAKEVEKKKEKKRKKNKLVT